MLEIGKLYVVKTMYGNYWLFKKNERRDLTACDSSLCLNDMSTWTSSTRVCDDSQIEWIKRASRNYVSIWNRKFNDNIELV